MALYWRDKGSPLVNNAIADWSGTDRGYDTSDEDDEDAQPAKRRKLPPAPTNNALTLPDKQDTRR